MALAKQHVTVHPVSLEVEAPAITTKVALGEADVGVAHATDIAVGGSKVGDRCAHPRQPERP